MTWEYDNEELDHAPEGAEGFIYLITYRDKTMYVGKKSFWSTRRTKVKGKLKRKVTVNESDWRTYRGSSKLGKEKAKNGEIVALTILHICASKGCTMYMEVVELIKRNVLCDPLYINANILLKLFRCFTPMDKKEIYGNR